MASDCDTATAEGRRAYLSKLVPSTLYGGFAGVVLLYYTDVIGKCREEGQNECHPLYLPLRRFAAGAIMYPVSRLCVDFMYSFLTRDCFKSDVVVSGLGGAVCGLIFGTRGKVPDLTLAIKTDNYRVQIIAMTSKALGLTVDVYDDRDTVFKKLFPTALYGGLASVALLFLNGCDGTNFTEIGTTAVVGAVAYPLSRFLLDSSYWLATNEHIPNKFLVTSFSGALCGLYFGSKGSRPHVIVGALVFALGAVLLEEHLVGEVLNF